MVLEGEQLRAALAAQRNEITEHHIYARLAAREKTHNRNILEHISKDELGHYRFWKSKTGQEIKPRRFSIWVIMFLTRIFGVIFTLKFMERGENLAQNHYQKLRKIPNVKRIIEDEEKHELALLRMLKEERLEYAGSIVLGLNDALVELTGALAGFTLALQDSHLIALAGLVTGIAASMSMAASSYLESKHDKAGNNTTKSPLKGSLYTGIAYIITVLLLVTPFFLLHNVFASLGVTLGIAIVIIAGFNFYICVAKETNFWKEFGTMALISLGVAALSFLIAYGLKALIGVDA